MGISTIQIILLVIFGCIAGMGSVLDSFQTHRPLIACTVVGIILGDMQTGIILGGTLEMIALGWMNIGAAQSPDSALASIISTILVIVGITIDFSRNCNCSSGCSCRTGFNCICTNSYYLLSTCSR